MRTSWFIASALPTGWQSLPLKRLGRVLNGGTPTSEPDNWDGPFPFVTPPDLNGADGALVSTTGRTLSKAGTHGAGVAPAGSVLVSTRAPIGHVGRIGVLSAFNQGCRALAPRENVESRFVAAALVAARAELMSRGQGTTFLELSSPAFASVPVPLPPLDEQRAIADYLDHETAQIDALVAKQEEFIGLLRERRVAEITSVVEEREPNSSFRRHVTNIRQGWSPNAEPFPADGVTEWGILKVGCSTAGVFRPEENKKLPPDVEARPELVVRRGEIVMSRSNTRDLVGSAAVVLGEFPRLMLSDLNYGLTTAATLDPEFAVYALMTRRARAELASRAKGTSPSMQKLAQRDVLDIPLWVPGIDEQRAIVGLVKAQMTRIDALIAKAEKHIALAKERRSALITAAVTGQIDVRTARKAS
ncbi:restriction endonuclease subunit S [Nocardia gipuzkoensis]|uniref:restriction endonuclease subunit S n=1 Tax=Nocardia gipuzkoensis TaxID=2749991 RepID=UPI0015EF7CB7|nr:restriction endonuclease subunit S [Nocardia gipuzkoensis]